MRTKFILQIWVGALMVVGVTVSCLPRRTLPTTISNASTSLPEATLTAFATHPPTATSSPTPLPNPTNTPTNTPTPTPALPVGLSTPLPELEQVISPGNAGDVRLLGFYSGDPRGAKAMSADGKWAFFASSEGIEVFDLEHQQMVRRLDVHLRPALDFPRGWLSVSADGSVIGILTEQSVLVLSAEGDILYSLTNRPNAEWHSLGVMDGVGISPDGKLAAIVECAAGEYEDCPFQVTHIDTGEMRYSWNKKMLELHGNGPIFSPDGSLLATTFDNRLWFWNTSDWSNVSRLPLDAERTWVFSPDGKQLASVEEGAIQIWDIASEKLVRELKANDHLSIYPFLSPDGAWVAGVTWGGRVAIWRVSDGALVEQKSLEVNNPSLVQVVDGRVETIHLPGHDASLWKDSEFHEGFQFGVQQGIPVLQFVNFVVVPFYGPQGCVLGLDGQAVCQTASEMVLGSDGQFYYGAAQDHHVEFRGGLDGSGELAASLTWSGYSFDVAGIDPQYQLLFYTLWSGPNKAKALVMDTIKGRPIKQWNDVWMERVSYSPDGRYAAFVLDHNPRYELVLFDRVIRLVVYQMTYVYGNSKAGIAFSPDSQKMAVLVAHPTDRFIQSVELIDVAWPHKSIQLVPDLPEGVFIRSRTFTPAGDLLAVGLSDGRIQLLRTSDGSQIHEWLAHHESVSELAFSTDGLVLASADDSGYIKLWGIWP